MLVDGLSFAGPDIVGSTETGALQLLQRGWVQRCQAVVIAPATLTCTPQRLSLRILRRLLTLCDDRDEEGLKSAVAVIGDIAKIAQGDRDKAKESIDTDADSSTAQARDLSSFDFKWCRYGTKSFQGVQGASRGMQHALEVTRSRGAAPCTFSFGGVYKSVEGNLVLGNSMYVFTEAEDHLASKEYEAGPKGFVPKGAKECSVVNWGGGIYVYTGLRLSSDLTAAGVGASTAAAANTEHTPISRVGQRVVRGPTWQWGSQDCENDTPGAGTIEKIEKTWISVKWDSGTSNTYRYNPSEDIYDIIVSRGDGDSSGGDEEDAILSSSIMAFDESKNRWRLVDDGGRPRPAERSLHSTAFDKVAGDLYIFGGTGTADGKPLNDLWKFSFATKTWQEMESEGESRSSERAKPSRFLARNGSIHVTHSYARNFASKQEEISRHLGGARPSSSSTVVDSSFTQDQNRECNGRRESSATASRWRESSWSQTCGKPR